MSKTWEADVWARPLSGARGVEKCLYFCVSALRMLYIKTAFMYQDNINTSVFSFLENSLIIQNNRK